MPRKPSFSLHPHARSVVALAFMLALAAGCSNGGGSGGGVVPGTPVIAPQGLSYTVPGTISVGATIAPIAPTLASGTADSYAVSPNLPPGLLIDTVTGVISGTPIVPAASALYTVTATNGAGTDSVSFTLAVVSVPVPTVAFVVPGSTSDETAGSADLEVALSFAAATDVTLPYSIGVATATAGADFTVPAGPLVIPAGATSGTITVTVLDDGTDEPDEFVTVSLGPPTGANLGAPVDHVLTITDNDALPEVAFTQAVLGLTEAPQTLDIEVTLSAPSSAAISVPLSAAGSAQPGTDYVFNATSADFAPGQTSVLLPFEVLGDSIFEGDETVVLTLTPGPDVGAGTPLQLDVTIGEDDPLPVVEISGGGATVEEGSGPVALTLALSEIAAVDAVITLDVGGTATAGTDYPALPSPVTIPAGTLSVDLDVDPLVDAMVEGPETVTVTVSGATNSTPGVMITTTVTIDDPFVPPIPDVEIFGGTSTVEGTGAVILTIALSVTSATNVDVMFMLDGTAIPGNDYPSITSPVTILAGALSTTLSIDPIDDGDVEGTETVIVTLTGATGANLGLTTSQTVTIDDPSTTLPEVNISGGTSTEEGAGPVNLIVSLSTTSANDVTVDFEITGSALPGVDFAPPGNPVIIPAGSLTVPISIEPIDEGLVEGTENAIVTLTNATGATIGASSSATILINDPGIVLPDVSISLGGTTVEGSGPYNLLLSLTSISSVDVVVTYDIAGTATPGTDYPTPPNPLTILAGSITVPITIDAVDDGMSEGTETIVVTLLSATNANIGTPDTDTLFIEDVAPTIPTVEIFGGGTVLEIGAPLDLLVTLSQPTSGPVDVFFDLAGSADPLTDYAVTMSPVTIPAGGTAAAITIDPVDDGTPEGPETIDITLTSATGADLGTAISAQVVIDEATLPSVELLGGGASGLEGAGPIFLSLQLSAPSVLGVQVTFTYSGTATNGVDYFATASPLTILPGNTMGSIALDPFPDGFVEGDETVVVTLMGASNATLGTTTVANLTIIDDASAPTPPVGLTYSDPVALYPPGQTIIPNVPTLAGGVPDNYSVVPLLPLGLTIDPGTGIITGAPTFEQAANDYTITASNAVGSTSAVVNIEVRSGFEYAMQDQTIVYDPVNGLASFSVPLMVEEAVGQSTGTTFSEIVRLSGGVAFDDTKVSITSIMIGDALVGLNGMMGPELFFTNPEPGGYTFLVVISFAMPANDVLIADIPSEWAVLDFEANPGYLLGDLDGETLNLTWSDTLGSPPVGNTVIYADTLSQQPTLQGATITFSP